MSTLEEKIQHFEVNEEELVSWIGNLKNGGNKVTRNKVDTL